MIRVVFELDDDGHSTEIRVMTTRPLSSEECAAIAAAHLIVYAGHDSDFEKALGRIAVCARDMMEADAT